MIEGKIVRVSMLNYFYQLIRNIFVLQETGKGLSTNDYTTDEKTAVAKITDIETDLANKVDGEVYDESGYVTGVSFKKGSYAISMGTNAGDPRISIKNDTTVNFDLAQTKELTKWTVYDTGMALYGPEYSSSMPVLTFAKTNEGVSIEAKHDNGIIKGVPLTELTSKSYVDGYIEAVNRHNVKFVVPAGSNAAWIDYNYEVSGTNYRQYYYYDANSKTLEYAVADTEADTTVVSASFPSTTKVQEMIAAELADISGVDFVVVAANEELPETGVKGKFYLKDTGATGSNKYDEYVWVNHGTAEEPNYGYEKIGTMAVDLTGYIKESDIQFATKADIDAIFSTNSGE